MPPGDIYASAFENARAGLLLLDRHTGAVREVNAAFLHMTRLDRDEVVGRNFWEPPLILETGAGAELHAHLCGGGIVENAELPLDSGDGCRLLLDISGSPLGDAVYLEIHDVTGRAQARGAERMDNLRRLAESTAREFQCLNRTLQMTGELLLVNAGRDRSVLRAMDEVQQASERAGSIAGELLSFSGKADFQLRRLGLNGLVESMLAALRQLFAPEIEITYDLSADLEPVIVDPTQMRQIVLRLAANAAEAMGNTGTFCVQTRNVMPAEAGLAGGDPYAMLAVSDSGPGLDDRSWEHLFEPFSTTKSKARGLGLAAVHGIVRQSGGHLWAYSEPGEGATFRIYLPLAKTYFPALPPPQATLPDSEATILVVEANDGLRTVLSNLLKKRGYRVLAALDPQEASRVMTQQGAPDLLISQPEPDLASQLMGVQPRFRMLYLAGYSADGQTHGLPPWLSVLRKPFEPEMLLTAVRQLLEQPL